MSKLNAAVSVYGTLNPTKNRKEIIAEIAHICDCSVAYASTLYAKAKKMNIKSITSTGSTTSDIINSTKTSSTNTIDKFTRTNLKTMRLEMQAAIDAVAKRHGITANLGNIRFSASEFTCKMTVETAGNKAAKVESDKGMFEMNAMQVGLKGDSLGKTFTQGGKTFRITDVKPRRRKYPISAVNVRTGGKFKFPVNATGMEL